MLESQRWNRWAPGRPRNSCGASNSTLRAAYLLVRYGGGGSRGTPVARTEVLGIHQIPGKLADLQTAGIAVAHKLQLATRDIADFRGLGLDLIRPWASNN
jgi:hypothetical protein